MTYRNPDLLRTFVIHVRKIYLFSLEKTLWHTVLILIKLPEKRNKHSRKLSLFSIFSVFSTIDTLKKKNKGKE